MPKRPSKATRRTKIKTAPARDAGESRSSDALTVGWTVSITMVLACDVAAAAAHFYYRSHPEARGVGLFGELLLATGAIVGTVALIMLPLVYRIRRTPPPTGFAVFAACAALAPILAVVVRQLQN